MFFESLHKTVYKRFESQIGWIREKIEVTDKLIFSAGLQIAGSFDLTILHIVVSLAHKGCGRVGFGI
jgi:hypothetical protein